MENTLVIFKPATIQRGILGEVISRLEKKGIWLVGIKMVWFNDELLDLHYAHIKDKSFFPQLKEAMSISPVVVSCWKGVDAVETVRAVAGATNCRSALPGTIRGDFGMSIQRNIVHTSDSKESAEIELKRFFKDEEIFDYKLNNHEYIYAFDEI